MRKNGGDLGGRKREGGELGNKRGGKDGDKDGGGIGGNNLLKGPYWFGFMLCIYIHQKNYDSL